jgi:hypothetical protein
MPRFARIVPLIALLAFGSHSLFAQEPVDTRRVLAQTANGIGELQGDAQVRAKEMGRKLDVLGDLTDAADSVSPLAMGQSLGRARQKAEEARREAAKEPPLPESVLAVVDIVAQLVNSPPFGMPADRLRARLFVEIGKLEEDILRDADSFQSEASVIESLQRNLERISASLRTAAVAAGKASLAVRRLAIKSGG